MVVIIMSNVIGFIDKSIDKLGPFMFTMVSIFIASVIILFILSFINLDDDCNDKCSKGSDNNTHNRRYNK